MSHIKLAKDVLTIAFIDLLVIIQSFVFLPIITKLLGAESYGIWSQIKVTISFLIPFSFLGFHEALIRFLPGAKDKKELAEGIYSSLFIIISVTLLMAVIFIGFSGLISGLLKFSPSLVIMLAFLLVFESLNTIFLVILQARRQVAKYFWTMTLKIVGEALAVAWVISLGYGLYGALITLLIIRVAISAVLFSQMALRIGIAAPNFLVVKKYMSFGLPKVFDSLSYWAITSIDRYFIGFFWGILFVGYYAPAYAIGTVLTLFLFPLSFELSSVLPKAFDQNNISEVKNYLALSLKYFLAVAIPAAAGLSLLSKPLLLIFSNAEIAEAASSIVPIIVASIFLYGITYFFIQILSLVRKTRLIAKIWIAGAIINIGLNILYIPYYGIMAAAISTLATYFCTFLLMAYFANKEFTFFVDWHFIKKSFFASFLMAGVIALFKIEGVFTVLLAIFTGAIIYLIFMFLSKGFGKKEVIFLKNTIHEMVFFSK